MSNKQELNQIFSDILGVNIILKEDTTGYDEQVFIKVIENWENAWFVKGELMDKYGILFEGHDNLLFEALDNLVTLTYGKAKSEIIQWYIYEGKDEKGEPYTLTDPNTKKSYTLKNAKDLFEFLKLDFDMNNLPEMEDEDDEE